MSKPYLIGITGGSGSGKTTFIKKIRDHFSVNELCIISLDDYYKDRSLLKKDSAGYTNYDLPSTIHKKSLKQDIQKILEGEYIELMKYNYNNANAIPQKLIIHSAPIVIVEGLFVFHYKKIAPLFDLKIFIEAKDPYKVARRINRDNTERNYPLDDVLYRYQHHVLPAYEKYVAPYKDAADIIVNNNTNFETGLEVVNGFLKQKLEQVNKNIIENKE